MVFHQREKISHPYEASSKIIVCIYYIHIHLYVTIYILWIVQVVPSHQYLQTRSHDSTLFTKISTHQHLAAANKYYRKRGTVCFGSHYPQLALPTYSSNKQSTGPCHFMHVCVSKLCCLFYSLLRNLRAI
jgi:hypothetical protein